MMSLIALLVWLLVLILIFGLIYWVINQLSLPEQAKTAALIVLALLFVLFLLGALFGAVQLPQIRLV